MVDVLSGLDATLEEEITSAKESRPHVTPPPAEGATAACHYCGETFEGPARWFTRGRHEKAAHHDEWIAAKADTAPKAKSAKKPAPKAKPAPRAADAAPRAGAKRVSVAESIARNLGRAAKMIGRVDAPLARALQFSSSAAGAAADELVAGTMIDRRVIQRVAPLADRWEKLGGVIGFPVMVAVISRRPELYELLEDDLREAALDVIVASVPTLEKKAARERKAVDALRRLGQIDDRYATTDDPIGLILRDIFAPAPRPDVPAE